jgi:hypothetical protein
MRSHHLVGFVTAITLAACAAAQPIANTIPDAAQCIESAITSFVTGVPDIAGLIAHCGATIADIEKVIATLEASPDGGASANPQRAAQIQAWKTAVAQYKAAHPDAK